MTFTIISWNVNGLQACMRRAGASSLRGFLAWLQSQVSDESPALFVGLQEAKLRPLELTREFAVVEDWDAFYSLAQQKKGIPFNRFSGVASLYRRGLPSDCYTHSVDSAQQGLSWAHEEDQPILKQFDDEGRCLTLMSSRGGPAILNLYGVANRDESRIPIKQASFRALESVMKKIVREMGRNLILLGDLNLVARRGDTCDPEGWDDCQEVEAGKESHTQWLQRVCREYELVDSYAHFHPEVKSPFTCWNQMSGARATNHGARLDYILVSKAFLQAFVIDSQIHPRVFGSDHCPVSLTINAKAVVLAHSPTPPCLLPLCAATWPQARLVQANLSSWLNRGTTTEIIPSCEPTTPIPDQDRSPARHVIREDTAQAKSPHSSAQQTLAAFFVNSGRKRQRTPDEAPSPPQRLTTPPPAAETHPTSNLFPKSGDELSEELRAKMREAVSYLSEKEQRLYFEIAPNAPRCPGHALPAVLRLTKKKGDNFGRRFWTCCCASGREGDQRSRCNYFKWQAPRGRST